MIDFSNWLIRWDAQQQHYLPDREERFTYMFDVIKVYLGEEFTALDLACGPGSLSQRLIRTFPKATIHAVDVDPMLLKVANEAVGDYDGRISFYDIDLRKKDWFDKLPIENVDVVLSTTALHWLPPSDLLRLYNQLFEVIRPSGIFMNGDHVKYPPSKSEFQQISDDIKDLWEERGDRMVEGENWDNWWELFKKDFNENGLDNLVQEREERFHWRDHTEYSSPSYPLQIGALEDAGFSEVDTIWQHLHNRVLLAIK